MNCLSFRSVREPTSVIADMNPTDPLAAAVLRRYPAALWGSLHSLGNRGGFSGAQLWQVRSPAGSLCLRAWPARGPDAPSLDWIHQLMARARNAGLDVVPAVIATADGCTWVEHAGRLWELTSWQPGRADFLDRPTRDRLGAACLTLARLHVAWAERVRPGLCPAVLRRLARAKRWADLVASGWRLPPKAEGAIYRPVAERAWEMVQRHAHWVPFVLNPWANQPLRVQPCLCDVWHDHLLFEGDELRGLIDFGAVKRDHVAVDLARLLGSLVGDDSESWAWGLGAYRSIRQLSEDEEALARALDRTGVVVGAMNWLRWLYQEGRRFEDPDGVARRLGALVKRMEGWS